MSTTIVSGRRIGASLTQDFAGKLRPQRTAQICPGTKRMRLSLIFGLAFAWSGLVLFKLFTLQIADSETWQDWAVKQHVTEVKLASERGPILDRDNRLLAVSVPASSIYARPKQIQDKDGVAKRLAKHLDMTPKEVLAKLEQPAPFVWMKRQIPRPLAERIENEEIPGVGSALESRRFYPYGEAASTLIGKVGIDGNGLSGLEAVYEKHLHAEHVSTKLTRDAFGNLIEVPGSEDGEFELPRGSSLQVTLDAGLQVIMDEELERGRVSANAKHAMAVMIDSHSGDVLALSQSPGINLNTVSVRKRGDLNNKLIETVYEPGSTLKPLVMAAAIEQGVVSAGEVFDCESGRYHFASHTIKDVHPYSLLSAREIMIRSSNIGMTKIGSRLGREKLYGYLTRFGFGQSSNLGLPGETRGILRSVKDWAMVDVATHSFGQGVAVTPMQMVRGFAALANGGTLPRLGIIAREEGEEQERVISARTASIVRDMLHGVVEDAHGTGKLAAVKGLRVGGKTGTAQKARKNGRGYEPGAYVASFIGFADGSGLGLNKSLTMIVMIDEPATTSIYGGTLAAPVFQRIMQKSMHYLTTRHEMSPEDRPSYLRDLRSSPDNALQKVAFVR